LQPQHPAFRILTPYAHQERHQANTISDIHHFVEGLPEIQKMQDSLPIRKRFPI
jgi:hypothetical protein